MRAAAEAPPRPTPTPTPTTIQTPREVIDSADDIAVHVDLGLHGIAICDGHSAYYKPSVALTSGVARHDLLLDKLTKKAWLLPGAWRDPCTTLQRTSWEHYCEVPADPGQVLHLRRLRPASLEALRGGVSSESPPGCGSAYGRAVG